MPDFDGTPHGDFEHGHPEGGFDYGPHEGGFAHGPHGGGGFGFGYGHFYGPFGHGGFFEPNHFDFPGMFSDNRPHHRDRYSVYTESDGYSNITKMAGYAFFIGGIVVIGLVCIFILSL